MKIAYSAIIKKDKSQHYFVKFPQFPEAITEGLRLEEALQNASDALTITLEGRMDEKIKIPLPVIKKQKNAYLITPSARVQTALLFRWHQGEKKTADLARALNTSWPAIARLQNPHHWASLKQLEKLAHALGRKLIISLE